MSVAINSSQVYEIIVTYVDKIIEYVNLVMSKLDAEVSSSIVRGGIFLSAPIFILYFSASISIKCTSILPPPRFTFMPEIMPSCESAAMLHIP